MNRDQYISNRRIKRFAAGMRTECGLPHHPDGSGLAKCPGCNGYGVHDTWPNDPQQSQSFTCTTCDGSGVVSDGFRDPLLRLKYARSRWQRNKDKGWRYNMLRKVCAVPAWRLRLIEAAVGCELAAQRALGAWRSI